MPESNIEFEYWVRQDVPREGSTEVQQLYELDLGCPTVSVGSLAIARTEGGGSSRTFFDQQN